MTEGECDDKTIHILYYKVLFFSCAGSFRLATRATSLSEGGTVNAPFVHYAIVLQKMILCQQAGLPLEGTVAANADG